MKSFILINVWLFALSFFVVGQQKPHMRYEDKVRIREAQKIANQFGDQIWENYQKTAFIMLLVTDDFEFLINHPNPSSDFKNLGKDDFLASNIYYRKRQFNKSFQATFPAVNGLNCMVIGTPENTESKNSSRWIITVLHEHFHQYQYTDPTYYANVSALDLAKGDKTGMWQLNYKFPYEDHTVNEKYMDYAQNLKLCINHLYTPKFKKYFKRFKTSRKAFEKSLSTEDYRYFSFQLWQEGLARYTEIKFLDLLESYNPSAEMKALTDFTPFGLLKRSVYESELKKITTFRLDEYKRVCFYAIGLEGLILDRLEKNWRKKYLKDKFMIENYAKAYR